MGQFSDLSGNNRHMVITNDGDWTQHAADLPNGEASHSLSTTLNENARWDGDEFAALSNGAGSEAITLNVWIKVTNSANNRGIISVRTNGTATTGTNRHWDAYLSSSESIVVRWFNTSGGDYLNTNGTALSAGWHMVTIVIRHGSTRSVSIYYDGTHDVTNNAPGVSPTYNTSDTYVTYLGAFRTDAITEMTDHMAEWSFFPVELSAGDRSDLFDAMA